MSKTIKWIIAIVVIILIIGGVWYYQGHKLVNSPAAETGPIKIGSILILTGEGSSWGQASRNGIDMAIEKINAEGGVNGQKLEAVHQDDQGDSKTAVSDLTNLADAQGVKFIIGTNWSVTGLPLVDLANQKKVIIISPSLGSQKFNEGSKYLFNTWPHDYILSANLADYVYKKGHTKVALISAKDPWVLDQTKAFKDRFEKLGGTVEVLVEPLPGTTEVSSDATKIKATKGITAIVSTTDGVQVGSLIAKRLRELDVKLPIFSITVDQSAIDATHGAFEGMEFLTFLTPTPEFKSAYESRVGSPIDIGADTAYDAVMMLAQAMKETKSIDPTVVAQALAEIKEYNGASGHLVSDGKRAFTKDYATKKVVDGKPTGI